jgi:hypothetical protein
MQECIALKKLIEFKQVKLDDPFWKHEAMMHTCIIGLFTKVPQGSSYSTRLVLEGGKRLSLFEQIRLIFRWNLRLSYIAIFTWGIRSA